MSSRGFLSRLRASTRPPGPTSGVVWSGGAKGQHQASLFFRQVVSDQQISALFASHDAADLISVKMQGPNNLTMTYKSADGSRQAALNMIRNGPDLTVTQPLVVNSSKTTSSARDIISSFNAMRALGVTTMKAGAARQDGTYNGYWTWAKLGFTGKIPTWSMTGHENWDLGRRFPGVKTVQDLMRAPGGPAWWKQHGVSWEGVFDFRKGSYSMQVFNRWQKAVARHGGASGG